MSLKILVVPFSIIMSLIVVIGYVKPDIDVLQEKKITLESKTNQSQNMTTLLSNISALSASLDTQSQSESLVNSFIPKDIDQERAMDTFNYLASQSGVFVSIMGMKNVVIKPETKSQAGSDPALAASDPNVAAAEAIASSLKPKVKAYSAEVEVKGNYDGIKDFFNRLAHMNRFHKVLNFTISVPEEDSADSAAGVLKGTFETQFDYFPALKLDTALNAPVFSKGTFDAAQIGNLFAWIQYPVSPLKEPTTGRPNPFQ